MYSAQPLQTARPVPSGTEREAERSAIRLRRADRSLLFTLAVVTAGMLAGVSLILNGLLLGEALIALLGGVDLVVSGWMATVVVTATRDEAQRRSARAR